MAVGSIGASVACTSGASIVIIVDLSVGCYCVTFICLLQWRRQHEMYRLLVRHPDKMPPDKMPPHRTSLPVNIFIITPKQQTVDIMIQYNPRGFGRRFGYVLSRIGIRTCIPNCKADSAKSNGLILVKFYELIACESRKTAFKFGSDTDHIRDAVSVYGVYPDYWQRRMLTKFDVEMAPTTGKSWVSCRSSRSKVKVKHKKNTY